MRTKIIATLGPKSESPDIIENLIASGMDIARCNFSHCTYEEYAARRAAIQSVAVKLGRTVKILQDLQGPRIRVGEQPKEGRRLREGDEVLVTTEQAASADAIFVDYKNLANDMSVGEPLYLANGEMELLVKRIEGLRLYAEVIRGGTLYSRKAVNTPRTKLSVSGMTEKDRADALFGLEQGVDYIAISFVQTAEDVLQLRELVGNKAKIVAKIETAIALQHIDPIIQASDAIMIARGDLGVEMPEEQLPYIQKNLIRHAAWHGKAAITATQMMTSMINHPRPTRAEVSDIANAVWDGTDAVMLSDETASGNYPLESVAAMRRIVEEAERQHFGRENPL